MRTRAEQEMALSQLAQFKQGPADFLQRIRQQALARCYEALLGCELDLQCHLSSGTIPNRNCARNGYSRKTIVSSLGPITLKVPRLRSGKFAPRLIPKYQRRPHAAATSMLEAKVLHLWAYDPRAELNAEPYEFQQLVLALFAPLYPELKDEDLTYLMQSVGTAVRAQHERALSTRYPVVVSVRMACSHLGLLTPSQPTAQLSTAPTLPPALCVCPAQPETTAALYLACGLTISGECELLELYRPQCALGELPPALGELLHAMDLRLMTQLRQRGVKDVILFLGPHWQLSWDEVQHYFPWATLYSPG